MKISPLDPTAYPDLDETAGAPRILPFPAVPQTTLVQVDDRDPGHSIT